VIKNHTYHLANHISFQRSDKKIKVITPPIAEDSDNPGTQSKFACIWYNWHKAREGMCFGFNSSWFKKWYQFIRYLVEQTKGKMQITFDTQAKISPSLV